MKLLYITGSCLQCNTSANMSHNSYLQGLIENGHEVDVIMSDRGKLPIDKNMPVFKEANYYTYKSISNLDNFVYKLKKVIDTKLGLDIGDTGISGNSGDYSSEQKSSIQFIIRKYLKFMYDLIFYSGYPYRLSKEWIKNASKFYSNEGYDIVISNSTPESSHEAAYRLFKRKHIKCKKWIQIWEDPWQYDLYTNVKKKSVYREESKLLNNADEIYYVSSLTLMYQKKYFPQSADKMKCIPLPYLKTEDTNIDNMDVTSKCTFGYFGDYYSYVRNLRPFYEAVKELGLYANIYGDSDQYFVPTDKIIVEKRVQIGKLCTVQAETDVLIMLCNLRGGQIPGKIYHYSATKKPIIFILDGTEEEKNEIYEYFNKFNRYCFCQNNIKDIMSVLSKFVSNEYSKQSFCVEEFSPRNVVNKIVGL